MALLSTKQLTDLYALLVYFNRYESDRTAIERVLTQVEKRLESEHSSIPYQKVEEIKRKIAQGASLSDD